MGLVPILMTILVSYAELTERKNFQVKKNNNIYNKPFRITCVISYLPHAINVHYPTSLE